VGLFESLRQGLSKTRAVLAGGLKKVLFLGRRLDESLIADLETVLHRHRIDLVLYANDLPEAEPGRLEALQQSCARFGAEWREFAMPVTQPRSSPSV